MEEINMEGANMVDNIVDNMVDRANMGIRTNMEVAMASNRTKVGDIERRIGLDNPLL